MTLYPKVTDDDGKAMIEMKEDERKGNLSEWQLKENYFIQYNIVVIC